MKTENALSWSGSIFGKSNGMNVSGLRSFKRTGKGRLQKIAEGGGGEVRIKAIISDRVWLKDGSQVKEQMLFKEIIRS